MSELKNLKPGEARCPDHPSTKELVSRDCTGAPDAILEESYEFIGDADIPFERYISKDFAQEENNKMWSKVWQWACHVDHIPEVGDYYVYDVADLSAVIVRSNVTKKLPCNWKAAAEAFLEAYHVLETHSEGVYTAGDANADYDIFGDHVSRFIHTIGYTSPHIVENRPSQQEILDILLGRKLDDNSGTVKVPEGSTAREVYARIVQEEMGEKYKSDFSHLTVTETIDSIEYFVFPNAFFFPGLQLPMVYRFRPDGVDHAIFDLLFLRPKVEGEDHPLPPEPHYLDIDDSYTLCEGTGYLGAVYDQDTNNLLSQTRGFKASPKGAQTLGNYQESRARHLHQIVDKYINQTKN